VSWEWPEISKLENPMPGQRFQCDFKDWFKGCQVATAIAAIASNQ